VSTADQLPPTPLPAGRSTPIALFIIGCSTGGPAVLRQIIPRLPADLGAPVLVVQHMPVGFVMPLAQELDRRSSVRVGVARHRGIIRRGEVWIAPADHHMGVRFRSLTELETYLNEAPPIHGCRPAIDPLAMSAARILGKRAALIVLTGMGRDGQDGAAALHRSGGLVAAQDAASSQVFGMPRAVIESDLADAVLSPDALPEFMCKTSRTPSHAR